MIAEHQFRRVRREVDLPGEVPHVVDADVVSHQRDGYHERHESEAIVLDRGQQFGARCRVEHLLEVAGRVLQDERGPKTPNLMAAHEVFRCTRCGNLLSVPVDLLDRCSRCGVVLHSCIQCVSFDTSARWECTENAKLPARVAPKDERNSCTLFAPRTTVERQTSSPASPESAPTNSARRAFDDLFK